MPRCGGGGGGAPVQGGGELPREAEVVVVGGGVAGTGVAYHLATRGAGRGVLLLEVGVVVVGSLCSFGGTPRGNVPALGVGGTTTGFQGLGLFLDSIRTFVNSLGQILGV